MLKEREKSAWIYEKGCQVMPGGVSSPVRAFVGMGVPPLIIQEGKGDTIVDVDGNVYVDFCMGWGSLILGHSPQCVIEAVSHQLLKGTSFGITTPHEKALAELICGCVPSIDKIRFVSSGTEATMTAVRLARAFTGRSIIVKFDGHYHGHSDGLLVSAGSGVTHLPSACSKGIPAPIVNLTVSLPFNDSNALIAFLNATEDVAAVILEPIAGNMGVVPADQEFIEILRKETSRRGIVLIFDEVITGFRVGLSCAQGYYGIEPDLTCLGKVIGGGFPVAAVGGDQKIMDQLAPCGPVYQAGTLSGNPLAMIAGKETLSSVAQKGVCQELENRLDAFLEPIRREVAARQLKVAIQTSGSMFTLFFGVDHVREKRDIPLFHEEKFKEFFTFLLERGVYLSPSAYEAHFLSLAHTSSHLEQVQKWVLEFLREMC
ncbi:MAG: glutamate-semialdehyde -aminomutase [Chlamydiota bacterium]|jgi:glutamate-1-semialdehyde 2,1-aminomutase